MSEEQAAIEAYRHLRAHTQGDLRYDDRLDAIRFVMGPAGQLVWPASHLMLDAVDTVLFVPENAEGSMELLMTVSELDPDGPDGGLTDRWRIYHLDPRDVRWATATIDTVRFGDQVIDGVDMVQGNPLADDESRLCRAINKDQRDDLRLVCRHVADADVESPLVVGIDPLGFDVRRRFDVVRIEAPAPMDSAEAVQDTFARLLEKAGAANRSAS